MDMKTVEKSAREWIIAAGKMARAALKTELEIDIKMNRNDVVTNMDKAIEQFFVDKVAEIYPSHRLLGEEGMGSDVNDLKGIVWILDPIDGTMNFVIKKRDFAITLGIYAEGVGIIGYVYDVMRDDLYCAIKGQGAELNGKTLPKIDQNMTVEDAFIITDYGDLKTFPRLEKVIEASHGLRFHGAAAIEFMEVATGRAGAFVHTLLKPWDIGGGKIIVEELGGRVTRVDGCKINMTEQGTVLVAAPKVHTQIIERCFTHYSG